MSTLKDIVIRLLEILYNTEYLSGFELFSSLRD